MNNETRKSGIRPLLEQLVKSTDALGAMAWNCSTLPFQEIDFYYPSSSGPVQLACSPQEHLELIQNVADSGQARIAVSNRNSAESNDQNNAAPVLALMPIEANGNGKLILETFLRPNLEEDVYRNSLSTIAGILSGNFLTRESEQLNPATAGAPGTNGQLAGENTNANLAEYCDLIHRSIKNKESASRIANETRRLLGCDRVSVMNFADNRSKIVAISGQQSVNRRSNTVRLMELLAKKVLRLKEEFVYPKEDLTIAPQVESALDAYLKTAVARCLCIIPLYEKPEEEIAGAPDQPKEPKLIGGLIIEHFTEDWELESSLPLIRLAADQASNAYANSLRHESLWLFPLWNLLGKSKFLTATRRLPITLSILIGVLLLTISLIVIPWEFKVVSDGYLIPEQMEYIYAPYDGEVVEVVEGGSMLPLTDNPISNGTPNTVARILSLELNEKMSQVKGQLREAEKEMEQFQRRLQFDKESNPTSRSEGQIRAQIDSLIERLKLLNDKAEKMTVDSTIAGTVLTHSTIERLKNRPFKRGDKLLEIANTHGKWIVELKMPDNRIGHVLSAQQELGEELKVTCVLATDPSKSFKGTVLEVAQSTEVSQETGQTVTIKVEIDPDTDPSFLHARSQVVGKVHCGRRSLGYVWFHQVGEFLQKNVWFRIW